MIHAIIADEILLDRKKLRSYLESIDVHIKSETGNAVHAFNEFRIFRPEIVFLSLNLSTADAISCMRRIKETAEETIVILIGEENDRRQIFEGLEAGADEYIYKPYQMKQIEKVVLKVLRDAGKGL